MLIHTVRRKDHHWEIVGAWEEFLRLPAARKGPFEIALLGAKTKRSNATYYLARLMMSLQRPVYLIDIRTHGIRSPGGCWPRELRSDLLDYLSPRTRKHYGYLHIEALGLGRVLDTRVNIARGASGDRKIEIDIPEAVDLAAEGEEVPFGAWRHWQVCRARYLSDLSPSSILCGQAFVEAARAIGGLAIFLCCEPDVGDFDDLPQDQQDRAYCHRFTLAAAIARSVSAHFPNDQIQRVSLSLDGESPSLADWNGDRFRASSHEATSELLPGQASRPSARTKTTR